MQFFNFRLYLKKSLYSPHNNETPIRNIAVSSHPFLKIRCLELGRDILETLVGDVHHYGGNIDQTLQGNLVSCPSYRCHSAMYKFSLPIIILLLLLLLTLWVEMIGCVYVGSYMLTHTDVELEHAKMFNTKSRLTISTTYMGNEASHGVVIILADLLHGERGVPWPYTPVLVPQFVTQVN